MGRALIAAVAVAAAVAAPAPAARVKVMVVGKERVLRPATAVGLERTAVRVAGRRCRVAARTPLAALVRARARPRLRDYGSCGRRVRDSAGLYVKRIGPDRARGRAGWVYKVGRRLGTNGAADPAGPFGRGGLRRGQRVLWFWCRLTTAGGCRRTLEARPETRTPEPGSILRVTVRGFDDMGEGIVVPGAIVRLGDSTAETGTDGVAEIAVPAEAGRLRLTAAHPEMVRSFPTRVVAG